jgi:phosphatidylcholine synthase
VAAFYLFLLKPWPPVAALIVVGLAVLTFVPFRFLHPVRVARLQALNIAGLILWSALALIAVLEDLAPGPWVAGGLVAIAIYLLGVGLTERR